MTKYQFVICVFVFIFIGTPIIGSAGTTYQINKQASNDKNLNLLTVEVDDEETIIKFKIDFVSKYEDTNYKCVYFNFQAPGTQRAFYLIDTKKTNRYELLDGVGISFGDKQNKLCIGEAKEFELIFEPIPKSLKRFHVIESTIVEDSLLGSSGWIFSNIKLHVVQRGEETKQRQDKSNKLTKEVILKLQEKLTELEYDLGNVDGIWGEKTENALKQFQNENGLESTGELDEKTKEKLAL